MNKEKKLISILTPCYNEEENIRDLIFEVRKIFVGLSYDYEHIFIDNCSSDSSVSILKDEASKDHRIKIIVNKRNFGHVRSPYYGLLQCRGDAAIMLSCDFQDPPHLIVDFVKKWEKGFQIVLGVKTASDESALNFIMRSMYYRFIAKISEVKLVKNTTGAGLYDRIVLNKFKQCSDPYPYLRGLVSEFGFSISTVEFVQPTRRRGISKNNLYTLYDSAALGIVHHSKLPLRFMLFAGIFISLFLFLIAAIYLIFFIQYLDHFRLFIILFIFVVALLYLVTNVLLGLIGEYLINIHVRIRNLPIVEEDYRINFD